MIERSCTQYSLKSRHLGSCPFEVINYCYGVYEAIEITAEEVLVNTLV